MMTAAEVEWLITAMANLAEYADALGEALLLRDEAAFYEAADWEQETLLFRLVDAESAVARAGGVDDRIRALCALVTNARPQQEQHLDMT